MVRDLHLHLSLLHSCIFVRIPLTEIFVATILLAYQIRFKSAIGIIFFLFIHYFLDDLSGLLFPLIHLVQIFPSFHRFLLAVHLILLLMFFHFIIKVLVLLWLLVLVPIQYLVHAFILFCLIDTSILTDTSILVNEVIIWLHHLHFLVVSHLHPIYVLFFQIKLIHIYNYYYISKYNIY